MKLMNLPVPLVVMLLVVSPGPITAAEWTLTVDTLKHLIALFAIFDADDDGLIEYTDYRDDMKRVDLNSDGHVNKTEAVTYNSDFTEKYFNMLDFNGDGKITLDGGEYVFQKLERDFGNDLMFMEFLVFSVIRLGAAGQNETGSRMSLSDFDAAARNYRIIDFNDDRKINDVEFKAEFRVADINSDGKLTTMEIAVFRPLRDVNSTVYCTNATAGCDVTAFMALFNAGDQNNDTFVDWHEYVQTFGKVIS